MITKENEEVKDIVLKVEQVLCRHHWAIERNFDVYTNKMDEYRVCIKCGKCEH